MKLAESRRLSHGGLGPRSGAIGGLLSAAVTLAFALIPLLIGGWIIGKAIGVTGSMRPEAGLIPRLFIAGFGSIFFFAGLFLVGHVVSDVRNAIWRCSLLFRRRALQPWDRDYPWPKQQLVRDIGGAGVSAGSVLILAFLSFFCIASVAMFIVVVLYVETWQDRLGMTVVALGLCGFGLVMLSDAARDLIPTALHWPRFGRTRVRFERFPFHPGEVVELTWLPPQLGQCDRLMFSLRHIREVREWRAGPKGSTVSYVPFEHWRGEQVIESPGIIYRGDAIPVRFEVPAGAPGTALSAALPEYWELAVTADRPGLTFEARYLVPIYRCQI